MPTNLAAGDCRVAGECVLQWFWFGTGARQTYESCVDFVVAGPGSQVGSGAGADAGVSPSTGSPSGAEAGSGFGSGAAPNGASGTGSGAGAGAGAVSGVSSSASGTPVAALTRSGPQATATPAYFKIISANDSRDARASLFPGDLASCTTSSTERPPTATSLVVTRTSAAECTEAPAPSVDGPVSVQEAVVPVTEPGEAAPDSCEEEHLVISPR